METYIFAAFIIITGIIAAVLAIRDEFMPRHKYVISVGGGIATALLLPLLAIAKYGHKNVDLFMAYLPNEHPDLLRLVRQMEAMTGKVVTLIGDGKTPWDIFGEVSFIGNSLRDPCSEHLKRKVAAAYMESKYDKENTTLLIGIGYDEYLDRWPAISRNWTGRGWTVEAPLANDPTLNRETQLRLCQQIVGWVPLAYTQGFKHNNCNRACVKQGKGDWARLLWFDPDEYAKQEAAEAGFRAVHGDYAILRDERQGKPTVPCTLTEHRQRMTAKWANLKPGQDPFKPPFVAPHEFTAPCVHCEAI